MAGHSQFKNIMHRKGAQDAKRAKIFAKITRELMVSVKSGGSDPASNHRLRGALANARAANMPKDNIDRAVKKGLGGDADTHFEEGRYEGYGPGAVPIIVEVLTDNRNRTAAEVRSAFTKHGGSFGESGSVSFLFERKGLLEYDAQSHSFDELFEAAVEAGADNVELVGDVFEITTHIDQFGTVRDSLSETLGESMQAKAIWKPLNSIACEEGTAKTLFKLIDVLEDNDDVQAVFAGFDVSDDIMHKLMGA